MKSVKTLMTQLTDPSTLVQHMKDTLRRADPQYAPVEAAYTQAAQTLRDRAGSAVHPSVEEYLAAVDQKIVAELIYVGWLGFQLNMDCFHNPINTLFLQQDFEELHREPRMPSLAAVQRPMRIIEEFQQALPDHLQELTEGITSYYTYLQTAGYKLAHYFGFRLADDFLPYVIPGYTSSSVTTFKYRMKLRSCLPVNLDILEG